jgi:hypothetical protein
VLACVAAHFVISRHIIVATAEAGEGGSVLIRRQTVVKSSIVRSRSSRRKPLDEAEVAGGANGEADPSEGDHHPQSA